ncbi:MAG: hypothetical protein QOH57_2548 [Mycobacterium sp.]|jgi:hypothetical protein|nr:hypothetical protein [Mycobacterium sp.]
MPGGHSNDAACTAAGGEAVAEQPTSGTAEPLTVLSCDRMRRVASPPRSPWAAWFRRRRARLTR